MNEVFCKWVFTVVLASGVGKHLVEDVVVSLSWLLERHTGLLQQVWNKRNIMYVNMYVICCQTYGKQFLVIPRFNDMRGLFVGFVFCLRIRFKTRWFEMDNWHD